MLQTIIVSAYLGGAANERKLRYFERLEAYLRQFDLRLLLVSLDRGEVQTECEYTRVPGDLFDTTRPAEGVPETIALPPELVFAAAMEADSRGTDFPRAAALISRYAQLMRELLLGEKPCLCVLWTQFTGLHRALAAVCRELDVPHVFAHLGILPGTIVLEREGQMAESWVAKQSEEFLRLPVDERDLSMASRYLDHVRQEKRTRKPQTTDWSIRDVVDRTRAEKRHIIFYAGQNDYHSGMWPSWLPEARTHSPFYTHTLDALQHLARLAEANDWHILFKPHPNIQERQASMQGFCLDQVDAVPGANIFECIMETDLTVTILSQASYLALIHERPTLLLGRNQLSGKGCAYEVGSLHEVEGAIQHALNQGFTSDQRENWLLHVAQVCKHYVFSFEADIAGVIGRDVDEAARYLMLQCRFPAAVHSFRLGGHSRRGNTSHQGNLGDHALGRSSGFWSRLALRIRGLVTRLL